MRKHLSVHDDAAQSPDASPTIAELATLVEAARDDGFEQLALLRQLNNKLSSLIGDDWNTDTPSSSDAAAAEIPQAALADEENNLAAHVIQIAERAGAAVAQVAVAMHDISNTRDEIAEIAGLIDGVALYTNILAINATLEESRPHDQVLVLAAELRSLAQRSAAVAKEIKLLMNVSTSTVRHGLGFAEDAHKKLDDMIDVVKSVATIMVSNKTAVRALAQTESTKSVTC